MQNNNRINYYYEKIENLYIKPFLLYLCNICYQVGLCILNFLFFCLRIVELTFLYIKIFTKKYFTDSIVCLYNSKFSKRINIVLKGFNRYIDKIKCFKNLFIERVITVYKKDGLKKSLFELNSIFKAGIYKNKIFIKRSLNIFFPVCCAFLLVFVANYAFSLEYVISVNYNGQNVGTISNENEYDKAKSDMLKQIVYGNTNNIANQKSTFELAINLSSETKDTGELTRSLISASGEDIEQGVGLYQNEEFVTAGKNKEAFENALNSRLESYKSRYPDSEVTFLNDVKLVEGLYPVSSIIEDEKVSEIVNSNINESVYYTVQAGDTPIQIAEKNNISYGTLIALNPGLTDLIYSGMRIMISNQVSLISVSISKDVVYTTTIPYQTQEIKSTQYLSNYRSVSKQGSDGLMEVTAKIKYVEGREVGREVLSSNVLQNPVNEEVVVGTIQPSYDSPSVASFRANSVKGTGNLLWPAASGYVSNGYLGYRGHMAIDIASRVGTPIYAADDGVVVSSGWSNSGYGYYVIINHGNGMQTLYAHNSKNLVVSGQVVKRGQTIAQMGSTGNATGVHVHFEVMINGVKKNPLNYL